MNYRSMLTQRARNKKKHKEQYQRVGKLEMIYSPPLPFTIKCLSSFVQLSPFSVMCRLLLRSMFCAVDSVLYLFNVKLKILNNKNWLKPFLL